MIQSILGRLAAGDHLSADEMSNTIDSIMEGSWRDQEIALFLTALRAKGETVAEISGAAAGLRKHMTTIRSRRPNVLDTCGTGGDGLGTFNVSTATAIVTAAAGVPVAKHGNRRVTSQTGSADVLIKLGVNVGANVTQVEACLDELGICFCFSPLMHPSMRRVASVRKNLDTTTIFNLLGPLANPARAPLQLLGVGHPELRPKLAGALAALGTTRALVVCGADGLDEVTLSGVTHITDVQPEFSCEYEWTPSDFGLSPAPLDKLQVDGVEASAKVIRNILAGTLGPARDIVLMNAAAALFCAGKSQDLGECVRLTAQAIDNGTAGQLLENLAERSHR